MYKIPAFLLVSLSLNAMEDKPHYHLDGRIVYLKEMHGASDFTSVSEFNKTFSDMPPVCNNNDVAIIQAGTSHKTKVIIASVSAVSTIIVAAISAVITYYKSKC